MGGTMRISCQQASLSATDTSPLIGMYHNSGFHLLNLIYTFKGDKSEQ